MLMHLIFRFDITKSSFILPCFCHFAHHLLVFFLSISLFVYSIPLLFFLSFCLRKIRIIHVHFPNYSLYLFVYSICQFTFATVDPRQMNSTRNCVALDRFVSSVPLPLSAADEKILNGD